MSRFMRKRRKAFWVMGGGCFHVGVGALMTAQPLIAATVVCIGMMLLLSADMAAGNKGTDSLPARVRRVRP